MRLLNIDTDCTDNGEGLRTTIYVAGCWHFCKGCHNPSSWNHNYGIDYSIDEIINIIQENELADVTISGGDSLTYQYDDTLKLVKTIKNNTDKNIWLYTGYKFDDVVKSKREILDYIDVLVDSKFEIDKRDLNLKFRGSSNQRVINVKESLKLNNLILIN
jgi:anaerobic ribonucleoside-triphosphate reductase activating protein